MSKFAKVAKAARTQGLIAAQHCADSLKVGLYQYPQWPNHGEVWAIHNGEWIYKIGDVEFCDQSKTGDL